LQQKEKVYLKAREWYVLLSKFNGVAGKLRGKSLQKNEKSDTKINIGCHHQMLGTKRR
jgi:hypothetical protein